MEVVSFAKNKRGSGQMDTLSENENLNRPVGTSFLVSLFNNGCAGEGLVRVEFDEGDVLQPPSVEIPGPDFDCDCACE
jgi:hypothetical protein